MQHNVLIFLPVLLGGYGKADNLPSTSKYELALISKNDYFVYLRMLFQLENTTPENIKKLLLFARENHLEISLIDDIENNYFLPGKPLTPNQLTQMIEKSSKSGMISMQNAHKTIMDSFNAD